MSFDQARAVADAVLYEGYVLYPYRASAPKNRLRWQFGVLVPPGYRVGDEPFEQQTECLVVADGPTCLIDLALRFLRAVPSSTDPTWDDGVEHEIETTIDVGALAAHPHSIPVQRGDAIATWRLAAQPIDGARGLFRVRLAVRNDSPWADASAPRHLALRHSLIGVHTMARARHGRFVSLLDPPPWAADAAASCENRGAFPVLVGDESADGGGASTLLASPIILYDFPKVAPESPGDFYDATEIDELLTLRTLTLTDAEREEAVATDPRSAALIERVEAMSEADRERLHGAVRLRRPAPAKVRLRLGARRADAHDLFLDGRVATVWDEVVDSEGQRLFKVTIDDDPGADLHREYGRFLYFAHDEVERIEQEAAP
jgi:hypothetical protein